MSLADYYRRQFGWRDWGRALDALPPLRGRTVLDLGCGVGDVAAELVSRGARVVGVDMSEELLEAARSRRLPNAAFVRADLRALPDLGVVADGLWCGFAAAYFTDLSAALAHWRPRLRPGGWIALTEIDDLFGHEPIDARARSLLEAYVRDALAAGRYDFRMGRRLREHLERAGFTVTAEMTLADRELAFDGPAAPDVVEAWRARLDGMTLLRHHCGVGFERVRDAFLASLADPGHRSLATVRFCLAASPEG